jgi:TonB family protein
MRQTLDEDFTRPAARVAIESLDDGPDVRRAEAGDAEAALRLGNEAASILREQPDCPAAIRWYRRAGELGVAEGYYRLGIVLSRGKCSQDLAQAQQLLAMAAKTGHVMALKELARSQLFGHAGSPDYPQAYVNERLYQELGGIEDTPAPLAFARRNMSPEQLAAADAEVVSQEPVLRELRIRASQSTVRQVALGDPPADAGWSYLLTMTDRTDDCASNFLQKCDYVPFQTVLALTNKGESTLVCSLRLTLHPFGEPEPRVLERRIVMLPGASRSHGVGNLAGRVDAARSSLGCQIVETPSVADGTCVMQLPPGAGPVYPAGALRRGQSGVVRVELLVPGTTARPSQAAVVASSGFEDLDKAAVDFLSGTVMQTNCPGVPIVAPVNFQLQD